MDETWDVGDDSLFLWQMYNSADIVRLAHDTSISTESVVFTSSRVQNVMSVPKLP
jgi:hypothetical protein